MIKKVGAILFSFLLLHAQAYALVGGPFDGGSGGNIFGTYSAVLIPESAGNIEDFAPDDPSRNSLALFALVVNTDDFAEGFAIVFQQGLTFTGEVVGLGDPSNRIIRGLIEARFTLSTSGNSSTVSSTFASGFFTSTVVPQNRKEGIFTSTSQRLEGTATLQIADVFSGGVFSTVSYILDGYKSSNATTALTRPNFGLGSSDGG